MFVYGYDASLNVRNSFPVFSTHIEANYVARKVGLPPFDEAMQGHAPSAERTSTSKSL